MDFYTYTDWEPETNYPDGRPDVYFISIVDHYGDEVAVIIHRTCDGLYPLDGPVARSKMERAQKIANALTHAG